MSASCSRASSHAGGIGIALLSLVVLAQPAQAGTSTSCESLTNFKFQDTTINSATSNAGGAYVAPDAWHLVFTNLPPYCDVSATIAPTIAPALTEKI